MKCIYYVRKGKSLEERNTGESTVLPRIGDFVFSEGEFYEVEAVTHLRSEFQIIVRKIGSRSKTIAYLADKFDD